MPLPYPTADEVEQFRALYEVNFGVQLDSGQAQDLARRAVQIFYLKTYGFSVLPPHPDQPAQPQKPYMAGTERPRPAVRRRPRPNANHALPPLRP